MDLHTTAYILAAGVQQRLHQSNFFTKKEVYKEIFWSFGRESCIIIKTTVKCLIQKASSYSSSKNCAHWSLFSESLGTSTPEVILTVGEAAAWKHRRTPLLHIMFLPLRNGGTTERQQLWPTLWLGLHLTPWVLSHLPSSSGFSRLAPHQ